MDPWFPTRPGSRSGASMYFSQRTPRTIPSPRFRKSRTGSRSEKARERARRSPRFAPRKQHQGVVAIFRTARVPEDQVTARSFPPGDRGHAARCAPRGLGPDGRRRGRRAGVPALPEGRWRQPARRKARERPNQETRRRRRVVGIFPNDASIIGPAGALLAEERRGRRPGPRRGRPGQPSAAALGRADTSPCQRHRCSRPSSGRRSTSAPAKSITHRAVMSAIVKRSPAMNGLRASSPSRRS